MLIESHHDHCRNQLFINSLSVNSSIVQIFSKLNKVVSIGTAVYIILNERYFLLTAGHIPNDHRNLLILENKEQLNSIPAKQFGGHMEWADIAVAELTRELIGYTPLGKNQIGNYNNMIKDMPLIGIGYPESQTKIYSETIDSKMISCITQEASDDEYSKNNAYKNKHIVLQFDKKNMLDITGRIAEAPKPNGMSGGGVFWIHKKGNFETSKLILIGILTRRNEIKRKYLIATQIHIINGLLNKYYGVNLYD